MQRSQGLTGPGVRQCGAFVQVLQAPVVVEEAIQQGDLSCRVQRQTLRGHGAFHQHRRALADHLAHGRGRRPLASVIGERPRERQRDVAGGVQQGAIQVEEDGCGPAQAAGVHAMACLTARSHPAIRARASSRDMAGSKVRCTAHWAASAGVSGHTPTARPAR